MGIYEIRNTIDGKVYIGSSVDLNVRRKTHFRNLAKGCHHNKHLQRAVNKYGIESFAWTILEEVEDDSVLLAKEEEWILAKVATDRDKGYNLCISTTAPMLGRSHTQETRIKISESNKGKISPMKGKSASENVKHAAKERCGENSPVSRLTSEDVHRIFDLWHKGLTRNEISQVVGSSPANVGRILRGKTWKHLKKADTNAARLNNSSGCVGVSYSQRDHRWIAQISKNGTHKYLGSFINKDDAIAARKRAERSSDA